MKGMKIPRIWLWMTSIGNLWDKNTEEMDMNDIYSKLMG